MTWRAELSLDYSAAGGRTVARHRHQGPLRVLQSLYPEGDGICQNVLVHPPSGVVGGDVLDIRVHAQAGAHGLVTTPGATRFYRSEGLAGVQRAALRVDAGARLEWLPLEAIYYSGCLAENHLSMDVAPGGELIGWDVTALGLPLADQPFVAGSVLQHIEVPGVWLERGRIAADDQRRWKARWAWADGAAWPACSGSAARRWSGRGASRRWMRRARRWARATKSTKVTYTRPAAIGWAG